MIVIIKRIYGYYTRRLIAVRRTVIPCFFV